MTIKLRRVLYLTKFVGYTDNLYGYFVCIKANDFNAIFYSIAFVNCINGEIDDCVMSALYEPMPL